MGCICTKDRKLDFFYDKMDVFDGEGVATLDTESPGNSKTSRQSTASYHQEGLFSLTFLDLLVSANDLVTRNVKNFFAEYHVKEQLGKGKKVIFEVLFSYPRFVWRSEKGNPQSDWACESGQNHQANST